MGSDGLTNVYVLGRSGFGCRGGGEDDRDVFDDSCDGRLCTSNTDVLDHGEDEAVVVGRSTGSGDSE